MRKSKSAGEDLVSRVVCQELMLVDKQGKMCAMFSALVNETGPTLRMFDHKGNERLILDVDENVVRVVINRGRNNVAVSFATTDDQCGVRFYGSEGKCIAEVGVDAKEEFRVGPVESP